MSVRRHLAWMGAGQTGYLLVQFASSVIIARLLTPYQVGVYTVALAVVTLVAAFQAFGLTGFLVRERELTPAVMRSVFTINACISLAFSAVICILSFGGAALLHEPGVRQVMLILSIIPIVGLFEFMPASMIERSAGFKTIAAIGMSRTVISQGLAVVLAVKGFSYMSIAYGQAAAAVFSVLAFNVVGREYIVLAPAFTEWRRLAKFGGQMLAISGVNLASDKLAETFLARVLGLSALGLFSRASNLNSLVWENVHLVTARVLFVDFADIRRSGNSLRERYMLVVTLSTALLWPAFAGLAVISGPFIRLIYGQKWVFAAHPLIMLSIASATNVAIAMTWELFTVCEETHRQARIESIRATFGLLVFAIGSLFGITGAAASRIVTASFSVFIYRKHISRMTDTHTSDFIAIYFNSACLTFVAVIPSIIVMAHYRFSEAAPLSAVVASAVVGVTFWAAMIYCTAHPLGHEVKRLLSKVRARRLILRIPLP